MLDAHFLNPATKALQEAARVRATVADTVRAVAKQPISPMDRVRAVERVKRHARNLIKIARYYNARAKHHTDGSNLLIMADAAALHGHQMLAASLRRSAAREFDKVDRVPPPDLE